jgi:hypothetical protein
MTQLFIINLHRARVKPTSAAAFALLKMVFIHLRRGVARTCTNVLRVTKK